MPAVSATTACRRWSACSRSTASSRPRASTSGRPSRPASSSPGPRASCRRPEPTHAIKVAIDEALAAREAGEARVILFNLCGHGHFDLSAYERYLDGSPRGLRVPAREGRGRAGGPAQGLIGAPMPRLSCWSCGRQIYTRRAARSALRRGTSLPAVRRVPAGGSARDGAADRTTDARTRRTTRAAAPTRRRTEPASGRPKPEGTRDDGAGRDRDRRGRQ